MVFGPVKPSQGLSSKQLRCISRRRWIGELPLERSRTSKRRQVSEACSSHRSQTLMIVTALHLHPPPSGFARFGLLAALRVLSLLSLPRTPGYACPCDTEPASSTSTRRSISSSCSRKSENHQDQELYPTRLFVFTRGTSAKSLAGCHGPTHAVRICLKTPKTDNPCSLVLARQLSLCAAFPQTWLILTKPTNHESRRT